MNIKHIIERMKGVHMGRCAVHQGLPCDCGAVVIMSNPLDPAPQEHEALAAPEIDLKGTEP